MEQLLKILEDNARLPIEDIATMLNKSPAEVAAMIDLARAQGIIKGYKTLVDWEKAGVNRVEAVIELNVSPKKSRGFDEIAATIAAFDEVESVLLMRAATTCSWSSRARPSRRSRCSWQSGFRRWTTCCPLPPTLCCAPIRRKAACTRTKKLTKESARCCDGL